LEALLIYAEQKKSSFEFRRIRDGGDALAV
jgi:hypothetical protein